MTSNVPLAILLFVTVIFSGVFASCENAAPPQQISPDELARLDQLTTLETIFPNASDRALYTAHDPVMENDQRSYTFVLKPQPGMDPPRHFQTISVTWARAQTFLTSDSTSSDLSSTGGPNGSVIEKSVQTADRMYDIRLTQGELLPNTAKTAAIDIEALARRILDTYTETKSRHR